MAYRLIAIVIGLGGASAWVVWRDGLPRNTVSEHAQLQDVDPPSVVPEANEYYRMALATAQQPDHAQTVSLLQKALALDPKFATARAEYALFTFLTFLDGASDDPSVLYVAEEQLQQAFRDNPKSGRSHAVLAAVYLSQGKKEDAARELAAAQALNPRHLDTLNWRFNYHWMNGDTDEAERIAKNVVERAPAFIPGRMHLAEIERERGNLQTALRETNKILEQDPRHPYGLLPKVRVQIDSGDLAGARETLELIPPQRRADLNVQLMNALLLAVEAKRQPALAALNDQVVSFASKRIFWTSHLAEFHAVLGDSSTALDWLERAVRGGDERAEWFQRDPLLANLRSTERFKQIQNMISFRRQRRR
jgi:tetratricopeptide (TPR) repeat protein